jgi:hypothetical protein
MCSDKLLFSVWPLTKVTEQGDGGKKEKERERQRSLSAAGDSSQKKGQKLKSPLIVYI